MVDRLKYILLFVLFLTVFTLTSQGVCFPLDARDISGRDYFASVKEVLDNARESIFMVMFIVDLDTRNTKSPVYKLCEGLVSAKKRGVSIGVILDQNIDFSKEKKDKRWQVEDKNENAFNFFKGSGIEVFYDDMTTYTHNKAIVVDNEIVILGSTNWSNSALTRNNETSVLIRSKELAGSILKDFSNIAIDYEASKVKEEKEPALAIYRYFLESKDLAGRMIDTHDERSFDLYLLLLREFKGDTEIDFDYERMAGYLGMDKRMSVNAYRRQLNKSLIKLDERYHLIEFKPQFGEKARVRLLDLRDKEKLYGYPKGNFFLLPGEYFSYRWDRRFSFGAKYCYLINLYMVSLSKDEPWWSYSQETLGKIFHINRDTVSEGMLELRRLNIIEVEYSSIEEGYEDRQSSKYKALGLYSPKKQDEKLERLKGLYGDDKVREVREFAKVVFKDNDPEVLEDMIHLMEEYGKGRLEKAFYIVSQKAIDNPKRTYKYAVGVIKGGKVKK